VWNEGMQAFIHPIGREKDDGFAARKLSTPLSATYDDIYNYAANFFAECKDLLTFKCIS
jgi:hypothetical protein